LAGFDPISGRQLSPYHDRVRVVAYDCTYSSPKSVSLLHALGPEDVGTQVRMGHERATEAALGYLERRGARVRRRPARGEPALSVQSGGFVAAAFLHRTSRAPDPHLHTHVLVANLAPGPDGRWSALDGRGLYLELNVARDLYETQLRFELTSRLGVTWRQLQGSWADLAGIDPKARQGFSRRSAEIKAALECSGRSGPGASRIVAAQTRPAKDLSTSYEQLVKTWRERSYQLGLSDNRIGSLVGSKSQGWPGEQAPGGDGAGDLDRWAAKALGEHGLARRDGTFGRKELVQARCACLPHGASVADIEQDVERLLAQRLVVLAPEPVVAVAERLKTSAGRSIPAGVCEALYTTPEVLGVNERLGAIVRCAPEAFGLLAYRPGGRLEALDSLATLASAPGDGVLAVAPGRGAAASFEAVTGIETVPISELGRRAGTLQALASTGTVVVAEAQRMGPWELASVIESCVEARSRVLLFAPAAALESRFGVAASLAPEMARFAPAAQLPEPESGAGSAQRLHFAGREVLVVHDGPAARDALVNTWSEVRSAQQRALVVASDQAVVNCLRARVQDAGGSPDEVVEAHRLSARLAFGTRPRQPMAGQRGGAECPPGESVVIMLGSLPSGARPIAPTQCVHVAIVAPSCSPGATLARAAEVARPDYLLSELGSPPMSRSGRQAWREGVTAIEEFRQRWPGEGQLRNGGDPGAGRSQGQELRLAQAERRLKVNRVLRSIEMDNPGAQRDVVALAGRMRGREVPGLSR
jgi:conjugative relaxase-like TrwC/TraI family protein